MLAPNFLAAAHYCYSVESRDMSGWMRVSEHNASFTNITGRRSFQMMRTRWLSAIPVSLDTAVLQRKSDHTQNKKNSIDAGGNMNVLCWNGACCIYMLYLVLVCSYCILLQTYHRREKRLFSMFVLFKQNLLIAVVVYLKNQ